MLEKIKQFKFFDYFVLTGVLTNITVALLLLYGWFFYQN